MSTHFEKWDYDGQFLTWYPKSLGCSTVPQSKLEASRLIEECLASKGKAA